MLVPSQTLQYGALTYYGTHSAYKYKIRIYKCLYKNTNLIGV